MNEYTAKDIKNVALLGNSESGKTSIAETILFNGGVINRRGTVEGKNTVSDYKPIEQENGMSVFPSLLYTEHNKKKINIIDCPGQDDFNGGVSQALRVIDTAILAINAQHGVEVGTEIHVRRTENAKKPFLFLINQLDHEKANYDSCIDQLKERFGNKVAIIQYPISYGPDFSGFIDVLTKKMYVFSDDSGKAEIKDIPDDQKEKAETLHKELVELSAENDETLMETFFEKEVLTEDEIREGLKLGIASRSLFPVLCCSAMKNIGFIRLLDFITNCTPSPTETASEVDTKGNEIKCDEKGNPTLFIFKTSFEEHIGEVFYFKVASGEIKEGIDLSNVNQQNKERLSQLFVVFGKNRNKVSKLSAGDIGATVKLKSSKTFDTLTSGSTQLSPTEMPSPKHRSAIKAVDEKDDEKLGQALNQIHEEDPSIQVEYSKELKQIIIYGQGEYHLDILKWRLSKIYKVEVEFLDPKIPYRETITKAAQADYRHKKQSGGAGQFGEVHMIIEPYTEGEDPKTMYKINGKEIKLNIRGTEEVALSWGGKLVFQNCIVGGAIDARFLPAILKGIMEKMEEGPLTGCYARDIRVSVYDGKMHQVDSNEISFKLAGRNAFSNAFKDAGPKILEPIYNLEVLTPSDRMGDVMSDLQGRRAIVQGMSSESGFEKIAAKIPLAETNKYSTTLNSLTNGRAMYTMSFDEYQQVPMDVQEKLLKAYAATQEDE
jgi:elongation factor G